LTVGFRKRESRSSEKNKCHVEKLQMWRWSKRDGRLAEFWRHNTNMSFAREQRSCLKNQYSATTSANVHKMRVEEHN